MRKKREHRGLYGVASFFISNLISIDALFCVRTQEGTNHSLPGWKNNANRIGSTEHPSLTYVHFSNSYYHCDDLDKLIRRFWWTGSLEKNRYLALIAWDKICQPKLRGGLGIRRFKDINEALMAKLGWMLATDSNSLWAGTIRGKCCNRGNFWNVTIPKLTSVVAKNIWLTRELIRSRSCFLIGDGLSTNLWNSPWVPWLSDEETRAAFNPIKMDHG
ncbi:hypothetical protein PanWU01x14_034670 [Parasponia andersonii]|uniref:Uncharacterized protein n=1 Tax=Parasponia andersonii TaxID=3476 RepID=A0A2P5DSZ5_PARAD|nr:hypothetical protein PanWU01x14_034670 [Parasponia andersonii]